MALFDGKPQRRWNEQNACQTQLKWRDFFLCLSWTFKRYKYLSTQSWHCFFYITKRGIFFYRNMFFINLFPTPQSSATFAWKSTSINMHWDWISQRMRFAGKMFANIQTLRTKAMPNWHEVECVSDKFHFPSDDLVSFLTFCRRRAHTQPSNRSFRQRIQRKTHVFIENVVKINRNKVFHYY